MLALADVKLLATSQISKATVAQVQAVVSDGRGGKLAAALHAVSKKLMAKEHEGVVPTNPAELKKLREAAARGGLGGQVGRIGRLEQPLHRSGLGDDGGEIGGGVGQHSQAVVADLDRCARK